MRWVSGTKGVELDLSESSIQQEPSLFRRPQTVRDAKLPLKIKIKEAASLLATPDHCLESLSLFLYMCQIMLFGRLAHC